jgi:hypothetical protein
MVVKRVLCPARVRKHLPQFSWVDQRLVRGRYLESIAASYEREAGWQDSEAKITKRLRY